MPDPSPSAPPQHATDAIAAGWSALREQARRFDRWRHDLTNELAELPDTLHRLRDGAANFELVGRRLAESSKSLEQVTSLYESSIGDAARRSTDIVDALRARIDSLIDQSPDRVNSTVADMQRTLESLAELNPFWPRPRR